MAFSSNFGQPTSLLVTALGPPSMASFPDPDAVVMAESPVIASVIWIFLSLSRLDVEPIVPWGRRFCQPGAEIGPFADNETDKIDRMGKMGEHLSPLIDANMGD